MNNYLLPTFPVQYESNDNIVKGFGNKIYTKDNRELIDFTCGGTSFSIIGWGVREVEDAMVQQMKRLPHIDYKSFQHDSREELARILSTNNKSGLKKTFLSGGSGAEACEMAVHMSYQIHAESGLKSKSMSISRLQSYHGATMGSLLLGERPNLEFYRSLQPTSNHAFIEEHNPLKHQKHGELDSEYVIRSANMLEEKILELGPENVGCFISETMLGGLVGDVPPLKGYWTKIQEICNKYNVHLILDEVWCGTGISGNYFCCDADNVKPDFVFIGKTLAAGYAPCSAVLMSERISNILINDIGRIQTSCTYQGHLVSVAAAIAVQNYILNNDLVRYAGDQGRKIRNLIHEELKDNSFYRNVRGRGLRNSIEFDCVEKEKFALYLGKYLKTKYNLLVSSKWHRLSFTPPMTTSVSEIELAIMNIIKAFKFCSSTWTKQKADTLKNTYTF